MAVTTSPKTRSRKEILNLLTVSKSAQGELVIVNSTIIESLINLLTDDQISVLINKQAAVLPPESSELIGPYIKASRKHLGLSQRAFAKALQAEGLRIHSSDIGNLEAGHRLNHYRDERIHEFKECVAKLLARQAK